MANNGTRGGVSTAHAVLAVSTPPLVPLLAIQHAITIMYNAYPVYKSTRIQEHVLST